MNGLGFISFVALAILTFYMHGRMSRRFMNGLGQGYEQLGRQGKTFEEAAHQLLTAAWVRVAAEHSTYSFNDEDLPGLITVKCVKCGDLVGTIPNNPDEDSVEVPTDLIKGHIDQVFEKSLELGRASAAKIISEIK